ncbi:hypothetical protein [Phaeobacter sp. C3_T13_0]|uniref:hypothetical protein n=1 Tax=Phaeobacter cretensis TaxID=3342641 RepID=UPI0039BC5C11
MSKTLSEFMLAPDRSNLWSARKRDLRCTALRLRDGSLCLYSPVLGLGDLARESLASLGDVSVLLAPNHYHHKGLAQYATAFPDAELICSNYARPRLEKQTGLSFGNLTRLAKLLPDVYQIVEPEGLKTGEVWLTYQTSTACGWIVCDAFKGSSNKADDVARRIELLKAFPTFGIKDKDTYSIWVEGMLATKPPNTILPCHGSIVESENLAVDIKSLLA